MEELLWSDTIPEVIWSLLIRWRLLLSPASTRIAKCKMFCKLIQGLTASNLWGSSQHSYVHYIHRTLSRCWNVSETTLEIMRERSMSKLKLDLNNYLRKRGTTQLKKKKRVLESLFLAKAHKIRSIWLIIVNMQNEMMRYHFYYLYLKNLRIFQNPELARVSENRLSHILCRNNTDPT